ncbi:solute carrier family 41 member 1-like [Ornithodoros turicata]|uniref:solute carrier family 41 member 1-like n=1 Tax=Ornithodoros turicata TaxID=34597 RepID=UPI00313A07F1
MLLDGVPKTTAQESPQPLSTKQSVQYGSTETNIGLYTAGNVEFVTVQPLIQAKKGAPDQPGEMEPLLRNSDFEAESWWKFLMQVFPSFMLAGFGMVGAGLLLDEVKTWPAFVEVSELFILVPGLLGLKGNLEMTLASRLSTQANMGGTNTARDVLKTSIANMALLQCQSVVVGALASFYAVLTTMVTGTSVTGSHVALIVSTSTITASLASLVLGGVMIAVVVSSKRCGVNPDNVAIPIAASLGDITTLGLLAFVSTCLLDFPGQDVWIPLLVVAALTLLLPVWIILAYKNKHTKDVLFSGWMPIISAMVISSLGGNILDAVIKRFGEMATFQPLMNGVGGNLAAVQASRMSTYLHSHRDEPIYAEVKQLDGPVGGSSVVCSIFSSRDSNVRSKYLLLLLVIPGQLVFLTIISLVDMGSFQLSFGFVLLYTATALVQVALLLQLTHSLIAIMWRRKMDPDTAAIPFVTAFGDLIGTGLLALDFWFMATIGMPAEVP